MLAVLAALVLVLPQWPQPRPLVVHGARVLAADGASWREGVALLLRAGRIEPDSALDPADLPEHDELELTGLFLVPGLIDLHTHLLLHAYDEAPWDDQVLRESLELRTIRAVTAARATLEAGFTTIRELGTEGAGFADVALRDAVEQGLVPGPRVLAATRAIVATGCYGPSGFDPRWDVPKGAQEADGADGLRVAVRQQVAAGADWIKFYADYRRASGDPVTATFSLEEMEALVDEARSAGKPVAAHATGDEGARRAALAGVQTIEHGSELSLATLALMKEQGVVLVPTLAASEAVARYAGWDGRSPAPERVAAGAATVRRARELGVAIACGSDAGVFDHGENARELELLSECLGSPAAALRAATLDAARVLDRPDLGRIAPGCTADLVALRSDPLVDVRAVREVVLVIQGGRVVLDRRGAR
jgi:imidazolonepropionase-like amidohydrolase